jgi:hypothetical protein
MSHRLESRLLAFGASYSLNGVRPPSSVSCCLILRGPKSASVG